MVTTVAASVVLLLLLAAGAAVDGRVISNRNSSTSLVSDGVHDLPDGSPYLLLGPFSAVSATDSCDQTYGFLPCTTTVVGNLFLILVYGYLMFLAATYLSSGSELLLQILGPGLVGGLFLPMLGALPDAMLILGRNFDFFSFFYRESVGKWKNDRSVDEKAVEKNRTVISFFFQRY